MFSTDCAVSDVQLTHVKLKTPLEILAGFQLLNTSAEKSVSERQVCHACKKFWQTGSDVEKEVKGVPIHAYFTDVAEGMLLILNDAMSE